MRAKKLFLAGPAGPISLVALLAASCAAPVASPPAAHTATSTAATAHVLAAADAIGSVRGVVVGLEGYGTPLGGATVNVGSLTTTAAVQGDGASPPPGPQASAVPVEQALPQPPSASPWLVTHSPLPLKLLADTAPAPLDAAHEFDDPANADKTLTVMHDFGDGRGPVAAERHVRKHPVGTGPRARYVYLHAGEFLLEDVPAGAATLAASFCGQDGAPVTVQVPAGGEVAGVVLQVGTALPVAVEDRSVPHVLDWVATTPASGLAFAVAGPGTHTATVTFDGPGHVDFDVAARAGGGAVTIAAVDVAYVYAGTSGASAQVLPSKRTTLAKPIVVPAATDVCNSAKATVPVDLDAVRLATAYQGARGPGLVVANVELIDDKGAPIQSAQFQNLQLSVPLRRQ